MEKMLQTFFERITFKNFFRIDLTTTERNTAYESLNEKYTKGLRESLIYGLIALPCILFIDISLLVSVLIPITMVSGTAWFAVSLVNIKKKFENFGNELTKDLYRTFCTSLILLTLISIVSLNNKLFSVIIEFGSSSSIIVFLSGLMGTMVVAKMIYDVFAGATKYDMNDSMLTGQNEAAEKYFRRSLSLLSSCADSLRKSNVSIGVSSYHLGLAFYEIFNYVKISKGASDEINEMINLSETVKSSPPTTLKSMRDVSIDLIEKVMSAITNKQEKNTIKSLRNVQAELTSIKNNKSEEIDLLNLRLATILEEMEDLLMSQGEALFMKRMEIEKKFLIKSMPNLTKYSCTEIEQGYISDDERVRRHGKVFTHTMKKDMGNGYREETEKVISKEEFLGYWDKTVGKRIKKKRYIVPLTGEIKAELDVFEEKNEGLTFVEVEFPNEEEADNFIKPDWFGDDVTLEKKYRNSNLAK
ncbi:CYTH domain-containing protein [Candidatus Shapirobacteria bacterium]|nr:CYTH domain-containing protein [Candidatus Shapirobacteria bacterium]